MNAVGGRGYGADMTPAFDYVEAILEHSAGFAAAAHDNLDAPVEHCAPWSVTDLVAHLIQVQWFWATIAAGRLDEPPPDEMQPAAPPREELVARFEAGAHRLAEVLRDSDYNAHAWTWAPAQQDIAFIARHQVQEAAVHHWDAAHAAGLDAQISPVVAADAIEEFLTFSVSTPADPADPAHPSLGGEFSLRCTDIDAAWTIADAEVAGTVGFSAGAGAPAVSASASDLLLWLYARIDVDTSSVDPGLIARFRGLSFTD
jgi:uncharacterized protein (TIGR03083 family)